jgi:putative peptidoglycan lipid II flippase
MKFEMSQKFISTIAGASIFISVIGLLSRGLGFIREMIFANNFGLGTEFDLYLVGAVLPITINSIILYIGQNYFVPGFQKLYSSDNETAQKFYKHSFITFIGFGIIISIILFFTSNAIIDLYMHQALAESKTAAEIIFRIFLVTIPFSAAISIFSALLQAIYEFKYPAVSILFLNISIIISLILFSDQLGVYIIPIGYVAGTILQFVYLLVKSQEKVKLNLLGNTKELNLSKSLISTSLIIVIIIESLGQLYSLFDRYFYADISTGGIAALNFASIIWLLPISIFSLSLATVVFPSITKAITDYSQEQVEKIFNENISMNTFIIIPFAFVLFFYGDIIIRLLFERGKFVEESTATTFGVLKFYSISLVFFSVYAIFNKIFYSLNAIKLLLWITLVGLLLKLFLNFILIDFEQNGLALSSSISYIYFSVVSYIVLTAKLKIKKRTLFIKDFLFQLINCGLSFLITRIISTHFLKISIFNEVVVLFLFFLIYTINAFLTEHSAVLITTRVFNRLNFYNFSKTK